MEILAPCAGPEHVRAAVYAGADAVYLGGKNFSARRNAANFGEYELKEAVSFCHAFGVKVYITVNILLRDNEMPSFREYLAQLAQAGPDALIVQDLGAARLIRAMLPDMPLHASTQMSVHSP
ncbi:MAG: U32 family peptidase, partial [Oscillospiraceae bacterium]|nr:U32 family peptidase [Oscillospiraceae bacterium]